MWVAVVSASKNTHAVLRAAGIEDLADAVVDGNIAEQLALPGKPSPATYLEAARRVQATPARAAVVEDAVVGVEAGRAGAFGLVIGVDRGAGAAALLGAGASAVVQDLADVAVTDAHGTPIA
ncbi:MAG TPA: HAD-IA family hydrolase, partial [Candidatus Tumulicola sp.]|nr:HAD-IA family hydrolase [Candidatus Tumulicola sp.]